MKFIHQLYSVRYFDKNFRFKFVVTLPNIGGGLGRIVLSVTIQFSGVNWASTRLQLYEKVMKSGTWQPYNEVPNEQFHATSVAIN